MVAQTNPPALHRVSRREPCPICDSTDWCEIRDDGAVHCMRVESSVPEEHRGGGWWHRTERGPGGAVRERMPERIWSRDLPPETTIAAPATLLDTVYRQVLAQSPVSITHRGHLEKAGITEHQMGHFGTYTGIKQRIDGASKEELLQVPGFYQNDLLAVRLNLKRDSLIVGITDLDGQVIGMQVRKDIGGYYWLSSREQGGASPGSPPHVAAGALGHVGRVWLTEGAKKADVCATHTGCTAIGLAGHSSQRDLPALLMRLRDEGTDCLVIAFDQDVGEHKRSLVNQSTQKAAALALNLGFAVRLAVWDGRSAKGIDDLLLLGMAPQLVPIAAALVNPDGSVTPIGTELNAQVKCKAIDAILQMDADPTTKIALLVQWDRCGYPGCGHSEPCPLVNRDAARLMGVSEKVAGRTLGALAASGLSARTVVWKEAKDGSRYKIHEYAPTRLPLPGEHITAPASQVADRDRKRRCVECGSEKLVTRTICTACGCVQPDEESVKVSGAEDSSVLYNREGNSTHVLIEGTENGPEESSALAIASNNCPDSTVPTRPASPSPLDPAPAIRGAGDPANGGASPQTVPELSIDNQARGVRSATEPRPWWLCACGYAVWSSYQTGHWYCSNCGLDCQDVGV